MSIFPAVVEGGLAGADSGGGPVGGDSGFVAGVVQAFRVRAAEGDGVDVRMVAVGWRPESSEVQADKGDMEGHG